jgi:hypothetical protein
MKQNTKLTPIEQQQVSETQAQKTVGREFATAEELLREDASQIQVPPAVEQRLDKSIQREPEPARTWWQRVLRRGN